ncbi:MAG: phosphatidate cytidylyltransferase [Arenimonas sp.]
MSQRTRVIAAAVMAPVAIASVLFLPSSILAAVVAGVMMLGLWEWTLLAGVHGRVARAAYLVGNAALMVALAWGAGTGLFSFKLVSLLGVAWWLLVPLWLMRFGFGSRPTGWTRALKLFAGSVCVIPAWAAICWLHASQPKGPLWALYALFIIWVADSGAYFVGSRIGKHKLAPRISPGKSWEGFVGGLLSSLLLACLAFALLGLSLDSLPALLLLTGVTTVFSVAGDLFESLLKRHAGSKDSSDLIPGHGGVLDRIDSLLAALPIFVVGKAWLGL